MAKAIFQLLFLSLWILPGLALAQTWEPPDTRPLLREIIAVDASGEAGWPFGSEDIAGDGVTFGVDEARLDIRTAYAAADNAHLWLRAYFVDETVPPFDTAGLYVFIDADDNTNTGGDATNIVAEFATDPTPGGYDIAVGVQGDGAVLGVWEWGNNSRWAALVLQPNDVTAEAGRDVDPIQILNGQRGYLQMQVAHAISGLNASCSARIFLRSFNAGTPMYGDLIVATDMPCVAADSNGDGTPDILVQTQAGCATNADCPGNSVCLADRTCLVVYECTADGDCAANETCGPNNTCVRTASGNNCSSSADCGDFVCDQGACTTCTGTGARACAAGLTCAPNGTCVVTVTGPGTDTSTPGTDTTGTDTAGTDTLTMPADEDATQVHGGACACRLHTSRAPSPSSPWPLLFLAGFLALWLVRHQRSDATRSSETH